MHETGHRVRKTYNETGTMWIVVSHRSEPKTTDRDNSGVVQRALPPSRHSQTTDLLMYLIINLVNVRLRQRNGYDCHKSDVLIGTNNHFTGRRHGFKLNVHKGLIK